MKKCELTLCWCSLCSIKALGSEGYSRLKPCSKGIQMLALLLMSSGYFRGWGIYLQLRFHWRIMHGRAKEKLALESLDNVLYEFEELTSPSLYCAQRSHMNHKLFSGATLSSCQPSVESVSRTHLACKHDTKPSRGRGWFFLPRINSGSFFSWRKSLESYFWVKTHQYTLGFPSCQELSGIGLFFKKLGTFCQCNRTIRSIL